MTQIEAEESRWQRWGGRLLPALTFLAGLALGATVVLAAGDGAVPLAEEDPVPSPTPTATTSSNPDTVVTLPGACEDAAANITAATRLLDDVVQSVRDFRPQELVELLNELEDLDGATRPLAEECTRVSIEESESESDPDAEGDPGGEPTEDQPSEDPAAS